VAEKNYKLKKGQWTDQVINIGVDKTIPLGNVTVVYNPDGSEAGFIRDGVFYNPGEKVQAQPKTSKSAAAPAAKTDPVAKYNLPPEVDVSDIKNMTPDELQSHIAEAKKRADAATKLYQNTSSSDTDYAYIKQANDSSINQLNALQAAVKTAPAAKGAEKTTTTATTIDTYSQLDSLQNQADGWESSREAAQNQMDSNPVGSADYNSAKTRLDEANKNLQTINDNIKKVKSGEQITPEQQQSKSKQAVQKAQDNVNKIQEQITRLKDKGLDTSNLEPKLDEAKKKVTDAQAATPQTSVTSNKLNKAQTDAFNAAVAKDTATTGSGAKSGAGAGSGTAGSAGAGSSGGAAGGGTSGSSGPTYSKTAPRSAVGVDSAGNWVDSKGRIVGTSVAPAISMMPKGAVGIEAGNWVDAKGNKLGFATPTSSTGQTANQDAYEKFRQQYGSEAAIIDSNPDLKAAFNQALNAPGAALSTPQWQAIYENSKYFKNSYSSFLNAEQARLAQPGSYVQAYNKAITDVKAYAAQAGISLDWSSPDLQPITMTPGQTNNPLASKQFDPTKPGLIDDILHKYWDTGANQTAITQYIASKGKIDPTIMGGKAQTDEQTLRSFASDLGLSNLSLPTLQGGDYFNNAATQIAQGGMVNGTPTDINYWKQDLINKAKDVYGGKYNTQLDAGQTIKSLAAPYINSLTNLLESSPDTINLSDPTGDGALIRNAMQKGTSPEDFAKQVMNDPRWLSTKNAKTNLMGIGNQFLSAFGLSALG